MIVAVLLFFGSGILFGRSLLTWVSLALPLFLAVLAARLAGWCGLGIAACLVVGLAVFLAVPVLVGALLVGTGQPGSAGLVMAAYALPAALTGGGIGHALAGLAGLGHLAASVIMIAGAIICVRAALHLHHSGAPHDP